MQLCTASAAAAVVLRASVFSVTLPWDCVRRCFPFSADGPNELYVTAEHSESLVPQDEQKQQQQPQQHIHTSENDGNNCCHCEPTKVRRQTNNNLPPPGQQHTQSSSTVRDQRHQNQQQVVVAVAPSSASSPALSSSNDREVKRQQQQQLTRQQRHQQSVQRTTTTAAIVPKATKAAAPPAAKEEASSTSAAQIVDKRRQLAAAAKNTGRTATKAGKGAARSSNGGTRRAMPKFLHAFCCCLRPPKPYKNYESSSSGVDFSDGRVGVGGSVVSSAPSPITQVEVGGGKPFQKQPQQQQAASRAATNSTKILMGGGEIRQRLTSSRQQQQKRQQNGASSGNKTVSSLTVFVGDPQQKQQPRQSSSLLSPSSFLLPRVTSTDANRNCLIVDLDETLVHSSFKPVKNADFIIPVEIDNVVHQVYVLKRPHTDHFLERIGALFECILFTASLAKYADPVVDLLDKRRIFRARLFRESCVFYEGNYVKDLSRLGRDLRKVIIIDNSPASYAFHPDNSIPVRTWFDDPNDRELLDLLPLLEELAHVDDIYKATGTVPPSQQPRCLTPSDDMLMPPPMEPSSPITQVLPPPSPTQQQSQNNNNSIQSTVWSVKDNNNGGDNNGTVISSPRTAPTMRPAPMASDGTARRTLFSRENSSLAWR